VGLTGPSSGSWSTGAPGQTPNNPAGCPFRLRVQSSEFRAQGLWFKIQDSGSWVHGLGLRV